MKSIKVSFDYKGRHYKFDAKFKWEDGKPQFTNHDCNEAMQITELDDNWAVYDWSGGVEVELDNEMDNIVNILLYDGECDTVVAMWGEFDNCKITIKGFW